MIWPYATTTSRSGFNFRNRLTGSASRIRGGWYTSSPSCSAATFTCGAVRFIPRPAGRSGCVITSWIEWPASLRARRDGTANSAVPAKTIFRKRLSRSGRDGLGLFVLFAHEVFDPAQRVEVGQPVDEQHAIEVVELVLESAR